MNPKTSRYFRKTLVGAAAVLLVGLLTAASPSLAESDDCYAELVSPRDGQTSVNTQVISTSVDTDTTFQAVVVSTTGSINVEIAHRCLAGLGLQVYEVEPDGTQNLIHETLWDWTDQRYCDGDKVEQTEEDEVPIGLNAGEYAFVIGWRDCNRFTGGDDDIGTIFDPPLPLPEMRTPERRL